MRKQKEDKMLEDIRNNNKISNNYNDKTLLIVTDNIQQYQQQFSNYNINNYKITLINWNDILTFITNFEDNKHKNLELVILDIDKVGVEESEKIDQTPPTATAITTTIIIIIEEIKKTFSDKRIFFILPSESMIERLLTNVTCKREDIKIQPFSVFDIIDLISTVKKKDKLERLQLKDHCMQTYSSTEDKIKDAIKFLKIGIKNNETTLILLDKDIDLSDFKSQMAAYSNIDIIKLQKDGLLKIGYSQDWYLSLDQKNHTNSMNTIRVDNEKIYKKFFNLAEQVTKKEGNKGLRIFGMLDCFFEHGLIDEVVEYDCKQPPRFNRPVLSICAYSNKYLDQLSENQIRRLVLSHRKVSI
jgi:uncharacterized membrane protein